MHESKSNQMNSSNESGPESDEAKQRPDEVVDDSPPAVEQIGVKPGQLGPTGPSPREKTRQRLANTPSNPDKREPASPPRYRLTRSQAIAYQALRDRVRCFFRRGLGDPSGIPCIFNSLLLGPTGTGKTILVGRIAEEMGLYMSQASYGSWVPLGGVESAGTATLARLISDVCRHERMLFFIDELDKFFPSDHTPNDWGRSIQNDVMMLLGGNLNIDQIIHACKKQELPLAKRDDRKTVETYLSTRLFLVGAGTWQRLQTTSVEHRKANQSMAFASSVNVENEPLLDRISESGEFPDEMRRRFNSEPIEIGYPDREDLRQILKADGELMQALDQLNETIDLDQIEKRIARIGMSAISGYKSSVVVRYYNLLEKEAGSSLSV